MKLVSAFSLCPCRLFDLCTDESLLEECVCVCVCYGLVLCFSVITSDPVLPKLLVRTRLRVAVCGLPVSVNAVLEMRK